MFQKKIQCKTFMNCAQRLKNGSYANIIGISTVPVKKFPG